MSAALWTCEVDRVVILPVFHFDWCSTLAVRQAFETLRPAAVAVEYPAVFEREVMRAVARMPKVSALCFGEASEEIILFEPVDPFVEGLRLAAAQGIPGRCVDGLHSYPRVFDSIPDPTVMERVGHRAFMSRLFELAPFVRFPQDDLRERTMAHHLQQFSQRVAGRILFLCGAAHVEGVRRALETPQPIPLLRRPKARLCHLEPSSLGEVMTTFPFATAVFEVWRDPPTCEEEGQATASPGGGEGAFPSGQQGEGGGGCDRSEWDAFRSFLNHATKASSLDPLRSLLDELPESSGIGSTGRFEDCAASEADPTTPFRVIEGERRADLGTIARQAHRSIAARFRGSLVDLLCGFLVTVRRYFEETSDQDVSLHAQKMIARFARRYAWIGGHLYPDFYELLVAGRGCVSAHYCYRMWEIGTFYPWQEGGGDLETIRLCARDFSDRVRKVRMNPHGPLRPRRRMPLFLHQRDAAKRKRRPKVRFTSLSICSFEPEDLVVEAYGRHLRSKGKKLLSEERRRVHPFETSLLDGIDIRETVRNWHTGRIYVQECRVVHGQADSVVVIFDEDHDERYPYRQVWYGEHPEESDMAFYATDPTEHPVGPGIRRALYGGFLMTIPPERLFDVFADPAYRFVEKNAERLLLAAIDYSLERFVVYAAPKAPRPIFHQIAARYGKRILHIPLTQLSPVMRERIRTFHILAGHRVREYAHEYIWS